MNLVRLEELLNQRGYEKNFVSTLNHHVIYYKGDDIELHLEFECIKNDYVLVNHFIELPKFDSEDMLDDAKVALDELKDDCNFLVNNGVSFITHKIKVAK